MQVRDRQRTRWDKIAEDELRARVSAGEFVPDISRKMGRSQQAIRHRANLLSLPIRFAAKRVVRRRPVVASACKEENDREHLSRLLGGAYIFLTCREAALLSSLSTKVGDVVTTEELLISVFGDENIGKNALEAHVKNLRKKISFSDSIRIVTARDGYFLQSRPRTY